LGEVAVFLHKLDLAAVSYKVPKATGLVGFEFQTTIEKLGMRKYKKKQRNEEANSHVKCRVPAEILGILYYRY
jgi:hypothetical protein